MKGACPAVPCRAFSGRSASNGRPPIEQLTNSRSARACRREQRGGGPEAEQGVGVRLRGGAGGGEAAAAAGREGGAAVALRAVRGGAAPLRPGRLRQEGAARVCPQRARRPRRRAARQGLLHGGEVHHRLQRRQPKLLRRHVINNMCHVVWCDLIHTRFSSSSSIGPVA